MAKIFGETMDNIVESAVGLYWFVVVAGQNLLLAHRCSLGQGESYGTFITCPHGHYEVWEQWREGLGSLPANAIRIIRDYEYEEWPRGRVVFDCERQLFVVYADKKITQARLESAILKEFGLADARFMRDPHYRSTQRLAIPD